MDRIPQGRIGSAHVIALIALFVSLCGSALAVSQIGSKQIKNNSVKSADLKDGKAVSGVDVTDHSLGRVELAQHAVGVEELDFNAVTSDVVLNGSLRGEDIQTRSLGGGLLGLDSITGAEVNEGSLGEVPLATKLGSVTAQREDFSVADGESNSGTVYCPGGQLAIAGGARAKGPLLSTETDVLLVTSRPAISAQGGAEPNDGESFNGWRAAVANQAGATGTATASVWVLCAG